MYSILIKKGVLKNIEKMPRRIQVRTGTLFEELRAKGPIRSEWRNFSKLSDNTYHCHLAYKWVVCWRNERKSNISLTIIKCINHISSHSSNGGIVSGS